MLAKALKLEGMTFGSLSVLCKGDKKLGHRLWECSCACGNLCTVRGNSLVQGVTTSCGCFARKVASENFNKMHAEEGYESANKKHGMSTTDTYSIWHGMISRCQNPTNTSFYNYGAKGVVVCDEWKNNFSSFLADMGERPSKNHSLERMSGKDGYSPGNVRWATDIEQARNRGMSIRNSSGKTGVNYNKWKNSWVAHYSCHTTKKMISKNFSIKKHGLMPAFTLACQWRDERMAELEMQGAGYSKLHGK